jgi:hypothetical protein
VHQALSRISDATACSIYQMGCYRLLERSSSSGYFLGYLPQVLLPQVLGRLLGKVAPQELVITITKIANSSSRRNAALTRVCMLLEIASGLHDQTHRGGCTDC